MPAAQLETGAAGLQRSNQVEETPARWDRFIVIIDDQGGLGLLLSSAEAFLHPTALKWDLAPKPDTSMPRHSETSWWRGNQTVASSHEIWFTASLVTSQI
jgi:hypothetical protein